MNRYKTFGQRLGAGIVDRIVFIPLEFVGDMVCGHGRKPMAWVIFYNALMFFYFIYLHGKYGQTIGKRVTNVKVVLNNDENNAIGFKRAFIRDSVWIGLVFIETLLILSGYSGSLVGEYVFPTLAGSWSLAELATMLFNKKRRAVHDLLAGSVVIDVTKYTEWERS